MGAVYRAWDLRLRKPVALKEMVPQPGLDPETLANIEVISAARRPLLGYAAVVLGRLIRLIRPLGIARRRRPQ